jgi:hypothetical protein
LIKGSARSYHRDTSQKKNSRVFHRVEQSNKETSPPLDIRKAEEKMKKHIAETLAKHKNNGETEDLCFLCQDIVSNVIFEPCYHGMICQKCALEYIKSRHTCPTCRVGIVKIVRYEKDADNPNIVHLVEDVTPDNYIPVEEYKHTDLSLPIIELPRAIVSDVSRISPPQDRSSRAQSAIEGSRSRQSSQSGTHGAGTSSKHGTNEIDDEDESPPLLEEPDPLMMELLNIGPSNNTVSAPPGMMANTLSLFGTNSPKNPRSKEISRNGGFGNSNPPIDLGIENKADSDPYKHSDTYTKKKCFESNKAKNNSGSNTPQESKNHSVLRTIIPTPVYVKPKEKSPQSRTINHQNNLSSPREGEGVLGGLPPSNEVMDDEIPKGRSCVTQDQAPLESDGEAEI